MKKRLVCLASVCVLLWFVPDWSLAEAPANSYVRQVTDSIAPAAPDATPDAGGGNEYYVDCGVPGKNGDHGLSRVTMKCFFKVTGTLRVDGTLLHGYSITTPMVHSMSFELALVRNSEVRGNPIRP
jgi:hypothetical protein